LWELTHGQVRLVVVVMAVLLLGWIAVLMINLRQFGDDPSAQIAGVMSTLVLVSGMLGIATGDAMIALQFVQETAGEMLHVDLATGARSVAVGVGCTLLSAAAMAWKPVRVKPLIVLNE
jgi:hypothetical protein